jgi:hypothetical protein
MSIVVPFSLNPSDTSLKNALHKSMMKTIDQRIKYDRAKIAEYGKDCDLCIKLLAANAFHRSKPGLTSLCNCVHIYKDWDHNFYNVYESDPKLAMWVGHLFYCKLGQDAFAYMLS